MNNPTPRPGGRPSPRPSPRPRATHDRPPAGTGADAPLSSSKRELVFGPDHRLSIIAAVGAGFALLVFILGTDAAQRAFSAVVVVVLVAMVVSDFYFAPRLTVTDEGVRVYSPLDRVRLRWDEIDSIDARSTRRYGLVSTTLEISAGEHLVVLDRRDLKADPWSVAGEIAQFRLTR